MGSKAKTYFLAGTCVHLRKKQMFSLMEK